jgi:hypothetical protein
MEQGLQEGRPLPLKVQRRESLLKARSRVHAKPIAAIKLTHKKPLVAEATQFERHTAQVDQTTLADCAIAKLPDVEGR